MLGNERGVSLAAVGDIMLGDSPYCLGHGVASVIAREGAAYPFAHVAHILRAADITFGNLETVLSRYDPEKDPFSRVQYRGQPEAVEGLADSGFDVLAVASNHTMQHGVSAFEENIGILEHKGILCVGAAVPGYRVGVTRTMEKAGVRFGFGAFNLRPIQYFVGPPAWPTPCEELLLSATEHLRSIADVVVLSLHWGDEFISVPSRKQVTLARRLVRQGADVVLGHHPHIVQGIERYEGALIAYSLGNFIFDMWQQRLRQSVVLRLDIRDRRDILHSCVPMEINRRHQPAPLYGSAAEEWLEELQRRSISIDSLDAEQYERELRRRFREFRREVVAYYMRNSFRYPPKRLLANVVGALSRRIRR